MNFRNVGRTPPPAPDPQGQGMGVKSRAGGPFPAGGTAIGPCKHYGVREELGGILPVSVVGT